MQGLYRIYGILLVCHSFLDLHDLQGRSDTWQQQPACLYFNLFARGIHLCDGRQRTRCSHQSDSVRKQSAVEAGDLGVCIHCGIRHRRTNELFQQSECRVLPGVVSMLAKNAHPQPCLQALDLFPTT